jgi:hypothetical protein
VKDIGVWQNILSGIARFAVISNACIIAFTSNAIDHCYYRFFVSQQGNEMSLFADNIEIPKTAMP